MASTPGPSIVRYTHAVPSYRHRTLTRCSRVTWLQRGAYANADVHIKLDRDVAALPEKTAAAALALKVMGSVEALLDRSFKIAGDKGLPFKKRLYVKLGCRGDWPEIQPPEWRPEQDGQAPSGAENA